jgi:hypothetical protein
VCLRRALCGAAHDELTLAEVLAVASPIPRTPPERDLRVI